MDASIIESDTVYDDALEFLDQRETLSPRYPAREGLRKLRNALAHGHYVSWKTMQLMREVERNLSLLT